MTVLRQDPNYYYIVSTGCLKYKHTNIYAQILFLPLFLLGPNSKYFGFGLTVNVTFHWFDWWTSIKSSEAVFLTIPLWRDYSTNSQIAITISLTGMPFVFRICPPISYPPKENPLTNWFRVCWWQDQPLREWHLTEAGRWHCRGCYHAVLLLKGVIVGMAFPSFKTRWTFAVAVGFWPTFPWSLQLYAV